MNRLNCLYVGGVTLCALLSVSELNGQTITIKEINPTHSEVAGNAATGGRVNHLARASNGTVYAASEFGGLFKSTDAGRTWSRLDGYLPHRMWDIKASPANPHFLIATAIYDGRMNTLGGISISQDGGLTWTKPVSSNPTRALCSNDTAFREPSAFGIAFDPQNPRNVYVGTNCGLAKSSDGGLNWSFINQTSSSQKSRVFDVLIHNGGIIDICGDIGHRRSVNGGTDWDGPGPGGKPLPAAKCSLAVSPDESEVLFATSGKRIFESDSGGRSWNTEFVNPKRANRIAFVVTNKRQGPNFDLWFGNLSIFRAGCKTPSTPGPLPRCPPSSTWIASNSKTPEAAHVDMSDLLFSQTVRFNVNACRRACSETTAKCETACNEVFDACMRKAGTPDGPLKSQCLRELNRCESECTSGTNACLTKCNQPQEACPSIISSDGGTYINTLTNSPACQKPKWIQANVTIRALHLWSLSGANISGAAEALYMAAQDNGVFTTFSSGATTPAWKNPEPADSWDMVSDSSRVVYTRCCLGAPRRNRVYVRNPGVTGGRELRNYPPGLVPIGRFPDLIAQFGPNSYTIVTDQGIFATKNISANPIMWTSLGTNAPTNACGLWASGTASNPTFFAVTGRCSGSNTAERLLRFRGTSTNGAWQSVPLPPGTSGVGIFTVDSRNPNRLFASAFRNASNIVGMFRSSNGGVSWDSDPELDGLMSGNGVFLLQTSGYAQPTLVAFDPNDTRTLVAGAYDAGVFLSTDNGESWKTVTNNSGGAANPVIPRPHWAYFDRECGQFNIYVGTQGRGAWRFRYDDPNGATVGTCQNNCESDFTACPATCETVRRNCMAETGPNKTLPSQCAADFGTCIANCNTTRDVCRRDCINCPE